MRNERRRRSIVSRPERVRISNERVAKAATRLRFVSRVPFLCECDDPSCTELVLLWLDEYDRRCSARILAPGHDAAEQALGGELQGSRLRGQALRPLEPG